MYVPKSQSNTTTSKKSTNTTTTKSNNTNKLKSLFESSDTPSIVNQTKRYINIILLI